jgi:hypothetical protein
VTRTRSAPDPRSLAHPAPTAKVVRRDPVHQRNPAGKPQLFEFDQSHKLVRGIGENVIGHQNKAHGMAIDTQDNIWICDENGDTVMKLIPEGKLLMTLGMKGQRGDWDEAKGHRLLW